MTNFRKSLQHQQNKLIQENKIFDGACCKNISYPYILIEGKECHNLYSRIRNGVICYFKENYISFWNGDTITGNTLSSQVSCLNHLFYLRSDENVVRDIIQSFIGERICIKNMIKVSSKKESCFNQFIAFEMVSDVDRLNEKRLSRGSNCTSIDALAIAQDKHNKKYLIVIEWKLAENDSGNKAPTHETSKNEKIICSGRKRVMRYEGLIRKSKALNNTIKTFYNTSYFHLPFYELMRQTLWAENNLNDFGVDDYFHITVIPSGNSMRTRRYRCINSDVAKGIVEGWKWHLTEYGKERYIDADPILVLKVLGKSHSCKYLDLMNYLRDRYYSF